MTKKEKPEPKEKKGASEKDKKAEEQRRLFENEIMRAHIEELDKQIADITAKQNELEFLKEGLFQLKGQKDKEMLFPMGAGILAHGKIISDEKVIVNVGANTLVEKTIPEAQKIIDAQLDELASVKQLMENEITKYSSLSL